MEISRDEVRVMTVHGAKGLEAPVVFLVDTTSSPSDTQRLRLIHLPQGNGGKVVVWAGRKADDPAVRGCGAHGDAGRDRGRISPAALCGDDARRRPADRRRLHARQHEQRAQAFLVRSDRQGPRQFRPALQEIIETPDGPVKRYSRPEDATPETAGATRSAAASRVRRTAGMAAHAGCRRKPSPTACCALRSRPTDDGTRVRAGESLAAARARAAARHAGAPAAAIPARRRSRAPPRRGAEIPRPQCRRLDRGDREALAEVVLALIGDARFRAGIWRRAAAPRSRSSAGWSGRDGAGLVSGQIDRLVVSESEVLIVDFKTNHAPPRAAGRGAQGLCPPACALPRGAWEALSPAAGPRSVTLDRNT